MATVRTQGLVFPLELSDGKHVVAEGVDLIKSSIKIILSWPIFTREYSDYFGSRIEEVLEEPNDDTLLLLINKFIIDAITRWEDRIELNKLTFERPSHERMIVDITYKIKDLHIEDTLKYTFYRN